MPRPRGIDWFTGASCAGLSLGLTQLALQAPHLILPPSLAFVLILAASGLVTGVAGVILLLLRWTPIRVTHATLVASVIASLVVSALFGPALDLAGRGWPLLVLGGLLLTVGTGLAAFWLAESREGRRPASAGLSWGGAALMLAGIAQLVAGRADWWIHAAIAAGLGITLMGLLGVSNSNLVQPRAHFGAPCLILLLAAAVAPFWPWWLPWLLLDRDLPELAPWPPNLLIVVLDASAGPNDSALPTLPMLEVLASEAVVYERLYLEPEPDSLLTLPGGRSLASHLYDYGYATSLVTARRGTGLAAGIAEIDDRPGGSTLLAESGSWMAGGALLLGPAAPLVALLGHDRPFRTPEQLGSAAASWLLDWRISRAPTPFQLMVDFRTPEMSAEAIATGLASILESLHENQIDDKTLIAIAIASRGPEANFRVLVVPPYSWRPRVKREVVMTPIWSGDLSQSLLQIAMSDGEQPLRLSGLNGELSPPKRQ